MVEYDDSGETCDVGRVCFLDGRTARGPEERKRAMREKQAYNEAKEKREMAERMNKRHPQGLAEQKTTDGTIVRPGGSKPWIE